jgi:hypothetical protein
LRIRIRIQEGKNYSQKWKEIQNFDVFKCWGSLLRAEGFSCSLRVLYGGLGISKLQFLIKKIEIKFPAIIAILGHQTLDPESGSAIRKNAGSGSVSGSALNQCGFETLLAIHVDDLHHACAKPIRADLTKTA